MKIFKKDGSHQPTKLQKRVAGISTPDLVTWSENSLYIIGKEVTGWMRTKDEFHLDEALLGAEALVAVIQELKQRSKDVL